MNRTDRLYALVEELRAVSPRPLSARRLATTFEVSSRTIERDLSALQQAGVPIWAEPGRTGGYSIDASHTLAPLGLTVDEALAVTIGLGMLSASPFRVAATSALRKVVAVMDAGTLKETAELASRIHLIDDGSDAEAPSEFTQALRVGAVLKLTYRDRLGADTVRDVEPLGYVGKGQDWYLIGWCRLRGGIRAFRGDRVVSATATGELASRRPLLADDLDIAYGNIRSITTGPGNSETPT